MPSQTLLVPHHYTGKLKLRCLECGRVTYTGQSDAESRAELIREREPNMQAYIGTCSNWHVSVKKRPHNPSLGKRRMNEQLNPPEQIRGFKRYPFTFLSNMHPCTIVGQSHTYDSAEAAYQAAKCAYESDKIQFVGVDGYTAKRIGKTITVRDDWNNIKLTTMRRILERKFASGSDLAELLLLTGDAELIEENNWGDTFWGVCGGKGENNLGKLLMERRAALFIETQSTQEVSS